MTIAMTAGAMISAGRADAQCSIDNFPDAASTIVASPTAPVGQSFVACQTGIVTNVAILVGFSTQALASLGLQSGTDLWVPAYTKTALFVRTIAASGLSHRFRSRAV